MFARRHHTELRARELTSMLIGSSKEALPGLVTLPAALVKWYNGDEVSMDVAIFDFSGSRWWAGRVLPTVDDLVEEVIQPTHALRRTQYLTEDGDEIARGATATNREDVRSLVLREVPGVVTFTSNPSPNWYAEVSQAEGSLAVVEAFRGPDGKTMLRLNGNLPRATGSRLGSCSRVPTTPGVLKVADGAAGWPPGPKSFEYFGASVDVTAEAAGVDLLLIVEPGLAQLLGDVISLWQITESHYELRREI